MKHLAWVLAVFTLYPSLPLHAQVGTKRLTLEMLDQPEVLAGRNVSGVVWHPDGQRITYLRKKDSGKENKTALWCFDIRSRKESLLLDPSNEKEALSLDSYQWSPQGDTILLQGQNDLWIYLLATGEKRRLTQDVQAEELATFSPTGKHVAFVKGNDLFAIELKTGLLERLTADGDQHILNGKLDWVYEEELADRTGRSYEWSPDGRRICYLRLDENCVPEHPLIDFRPLHPELTEQRYPLAGDPNSNPSLHVVTVGEPQTRMWSVSLNATVEYVAPGFSWTPDSKGVSYQTLNRAQDDLRLHLWEPESGKDRELLAEQDPRWINYFGPPRFLKESQDFLWLSERNGFVHLYRYSREGKLVNPLTQGDWIIDAVPSTGQAAELDEKGGWIYFVATERDPRERHLYRVRLAGGELQRLSSEPGSHTLQLSPDGQHIVEKFSSFDQPTVFRLLHADGALAVVLDKPANHSDKYSLAKTEFLVIKAPDDAQLYCRLVKPANFDPGKRYPVIVDVYGGPGAQVVRNYWGLTSLTDQLLAQEGYLIWSLDNRGSWGRGHAWEAAIFKNFGKKELEDQLAGVAYLKSLPYVDSSRIGIRGWSYGGYMTLYSLTHAPEIFKCGAAGAPVADFRLYDTIYTERYMRTPQQNPEGFKNSSPLETAGKLQARLFLIHGTADDNVHLQNTLDFVDALIKAHKPYELHIQPGERHGFSKENGTWSYMTRRLIEFFLQNL